MKKRLLTALLVAAALAAHAQPPSARLLAPEYRDPALLQPLSGAQNAMASANPAEALRELNAQMLEAAKADAVQPDRHITVPASGDQPAVDLYLYNPRHAPAAKLPAIYFIHGGGYLFGNARMNNAGLQALADQNQARVISVEYRLAVQAPFPADLDDAYRGLSHVFEHADQLGIDARKLIIMGESAGGGLAARLALHTRDKGQYRPAGQVLIYPMLDHRTGTAQSPHQNPHAGEYVWTPALNRLGWDTLRGGQDIAPEQMPYYSAAAAQDLSRLPRTFIMVGSLDLFVNEDMDYARRLISAGVPTELQVIDGVYHAFELVQPDSPQTQSYIRARTQAIARMIRAAE